jgi:uncharacterized protein (DUF1501 family)
MFNRREFLKTSSLLALAPTVPVFLARTAGATTAAKDNRVLVVVQLDGGNDALNTVVPFADPDYIRLRPNLGISQNDVIRLNDTLGLHPALRPLERLMDAGHLAVVPGVGYPNPSRSHFTGMAVWHTALLDPADHTGYGWLGRALDSSSGSSCAVHGSVPNALRGRRSRAMALLDLQEMFLANTAVSRDVPSNADTDNLLAFIRRQAADGYATADQIAELVRQSQEGSYPSTGLARRLQLVGRLLRANLGARVLYAVQSGYDTHSGQRFTHRGLLEDFAGAVAAFFTDLRAAGLADRVALLAFSEFGRTIQENASGGTDHGTAGCVFLAGPGVKGGVCGAMPSLTDLDNGEPRMTTDFRRVYATVLEDWLGLSGRDVLGGQFERVGLFLGGRRHKGRCAGPGCRGPE